MFDLAEHLRRWRHETELSLAFEPEEIDELEDHLKLAVEGAVRDGASPEQAWREALTRLGDSPPLAAEFAKSKLLPALFNLVRSWWQAGVLLAVVVLSIFSTYYMDWPAPEGSQVAPNYPFWIVNWIAFATLLFLLPGKTAKNTLLGGTGWAFCLIPLLHVAFYNFPTEQVIGVGWSKMGASFGPAQVLLGIVGFVLLSAWAWKRSGPARRELPAMIGGASAIALILAVSPVVGEAVGNVSVRDLYSMPTVHDIPYTGDARTQYLQWKFVDVLIDSVVVVTTWLPLVLMAVIGLGMAALQGMVRRLKVAGPVGESVFPATQDVPWIMTLGASGVCWALAAFVEPAFNQQVYITETNVHHATYAHVGIAFMILAPPLLFLVSGYELTKRLGRAGGVRPFYAAMILVLETAALAGVVLGTAFTKTQVFVPATAWLGWFLDVLAIVVMARQAVLLARKRHGDENVPSIWRYTGRDLVRFGAVLGLNFACSGLIFMMVAIVLAFVSTAMISALIDWGNSIAHPLTDHFDPTSYASPPAMVTQAHYPTPRLVFWIFSALTYGSFCLAAGLAVAMALSGLEFIRFNGWRYYKMRKAGRERRAVLAVNE